MNRYNRALCTDHQRSRSISGTTKGLQDLMRQRHSTEVAQETPQLITVKDWINADFETWAAVLKKKEDDSYRSKVSEEGSKDMSSKRSKNQG